MVCAVINLQNSICFTELIMGTLWIDINSITANGEEILEVRSHNTLDDCAVANMSVILRTEDTVEN